jgi:hypothetical protein
MPCAVKVINRDNVTEEKVSSFLEEAAIMCNLKSHQVSKREEKSTKCP